MALITGTQAKESKIIKAEKTFVASTGAFSSWDFEVEDILGNRYTWEDATENLGYTLGAGANLTPQHIGKYIYDYLTGQGSRSGIEAETSNLRFRSSYGAQPVSASVIRNSSTTLIADTLANSSIESNIVIDIEEGEDLGLNSTKDTDE